MNRKGQALVEFVIILPIFLLIVLSAIDFGNILHNKYRLENSLDYVMELQKQDKNAEITKFINNEKLEFSYNSSTKKVLLRKKIKTSAPGLNLIFKDPYYIEAEGIVYE